MECKEKSISSSFIFILNIDYNLTMREQKSSTLSQVDRSSGMPLEVL